MVTFDGRLFHSHRAPGLVGDHFSSEAVIAALPGHAAIGHVRYSTQGAPLLRNIQPLFADFVPREDGLIAGRMRAAGAVLLGKTNTPELGILPTTEPAAYGATSNPWDPTRTSGGSSGGAGAIIDDEVTGDWGIWDKKIGKKDLGMMAMASRAPHENE